MIPVPAVITRNGLEAVYGTDTSRGGAFLELGRRADGARSPVAEVVSPETDGELSFWMEGSLPVSVIEAFLHHSRERLAPPGWGRTGG